MNSLFKNQIINKNQLICHTGGAIGADTIWEEETMKAGGKVYAYSYRTDYHTTPNKVEISEEDYTEGCEKIKNANKYLKRGTGIYKFMNLLARNWSQVKYSDQIIAIGIIINPNKFNKKGYINKSSFQVVDGGTGYAVMMGIIENKIVNVFDQNKEKWYEWSYITKTFRQINEVKFESKNFTGIGTRDINEKGIEAIKNMFN
jgi:hypothetical protein